MKPHLFLLPLLTTRASTRSDVEEFRAARTATHCCCIDWWASWWWRWRWRRWRWRWRLEQHLVGLKKENKSRDPKIKPVIKTSAAATTAAAAVTAAAAAAAAVTAAAVTAAAVAVAEAASKVPRAHISAATF